MEVVNGKIIPGQWQELGCFCLFCVPGDGCILLKIQRVAFQHNKRYKTNSSAKSHNSGAGGWGWSLDKGWRAEKWEIENH